VFAELDTCVLERRNVMKLRGVATGGIMIR
jgi:hypothetical protein